MKSEKAEPEEEALVSLLRILKPLTSVERHRAVAAAMTYLGEKYGGDGERRARSGGREEESSGLGGGDYPRAVSAWMKQHDIAPDEIDQVFQFQDDGPFVIHDVPGKTKKERTLNAYVLTGVAQFLTTNDRTFQDAVARKFCEDIGCLDAANHAATLKDRGPEFSGDKNKGFTISNVGLKRGAAIVKEVVGAK
ncbi:hypothetical protein [Hyphomicrobium sp.]|uniref:hypothetical protein n=1 Tax=Hyphomicrobium sp. TaxID=82 RepID=UPI0035676E5F